MLLLGRDGRPRKRQNGIPKMNFPEIPGPRVSVEIYSRNLNFPELPGPIPISDFGVPIFGVMWGEMKLICWAALTHRGIPKKKEGK